MGTDLAIASRIMPGSVNEEDSHFFKPRKWFVIALAVTSLVCWKREGNTIWMSCTASVPCAGTPSLPLSR